MTDIGLTKQVKSFAFKHGASLVGIAPVSRWEKAPLQHSPKGIFPDAKTVVVCGIHIPDACVELGGEKDPRDPGPAVVQGTVTVNLNYLALHITKFFENRGYQALPIIATCFWNYRPSEGAERGWMADMCHYYAAACAGLGEIGWNNLCITPEFATRIRFISIITDAPLYPDPLYSGEPLCDRCLLCAKHCPTKSFDKEVSGNNVIEIEDKKYLFPKRNLWRCAIGENFQLDVFLKELPEKIDEKVITEIMEKAVTEHPEWFFGWKMGMCLKWCVNPQRRFFDKKYCSSPRRKKDRIPNSTAENVNNIVKEAENFVFDKGGDVFSTFSADYLLSKNIDIKKQLPDAEGAILIGVTYPENCQNLSPFERSAYIELLLCNLLEKYGYSALCQSKIKPEEIAQVSGSYKMKQRKNGKIAYGLILTGLPLSTREEKPKPIVPSIKISTGVLTSKIKQMLLSSGADIFGIASVSRIEHMTSQLNAFLEGKQYFVVQDTLTEQLNKYQQEKGKQLLWGGQAMPFNPEVEKKELMLNSPRDYLNSAKTAIVIGIKIPSAIIDWVGKGKGEKAGFYHSFVHFEFYRHMAEILLDAAKFLDSLGYKVFPIITGNTDSHCLTSNRIIAVAAGLGEIGWNGMVLTPEFGPRQIFGVLLTDAPLVENPLYKGEHLCKRCFKCVDECPSQAISKNQSVKISVEDVVFEWGNIDRLRCDWACKYGLIGEAGPKYFHSKTNFPVPDVITPEKVCEAIRNSDRMQRLTHYTAIVEKCFVECPAGKQNK